MADSPRESAENGSDSTEQPRSDTGDDHGLSYHDWMKSQIDGDWAKLENDDPEFVAAARAFLGIDGGDDASSADGPGEATYRALWKNEMIKADEHMITRQSVHSIIRYSSSVQSVGRHSSLSRSQ